MQHKLATLVELQRSYQLSRKYETLKNTGFRYIHYGDIHTGIANVINEENNLPSILEGKYETLKKDDIILADASEDYQGIAWPAVLNTNPDENIIAGLHTIALRPKIDVDSLFMYYTFLTTDFRKFGYRMGTGMKIFGITSNNLLKYNFNFPKKIDEQIKIRSIIDLINNVITLEQEKLNYLYSLKNFLLENLLTFKEKLPFIRFDNYNNLWRKYKLSDLGNTISGVGFPIKEQKGLKGIPFYKVSDMNNIGNEAEMNQANNYVSEKQISENKWNPIDKLPSIIFAKVGAALMLNRKRYVNHKFLIDNNMMAFSVNQNNNGKFIKHVFDTIYLPRYAQVGALPSLSGKDINNISIFLPSKEEQNKIVNILNLIDKLINNSQQKLNNMRTAKEYLLNNLFV